MHNYPILILLLTHLGDLDQNQVCYMYSTDMYKPLTRALSIYLVNLGHYIDQQVHRLHPSSVTEDMEVKYCNQDHFSKPAVSPFGACIVALYRLLLLCHLYVISFEFFT